MNRRFWTPRELAKLRRWKAAGVSAFVAAQRLGRSESSVYNQIFVGGLTKKRRRRRGLKTFIRKFHKLGWSDVEVAAEWTRQHPEDPLSREWIGDIRSRIGLPHNAYSDHRRQRVAKRTAEQLRRAGLKSLAELRVKAFSDFGTRNGWPGITQPRLVQILNLLYERGPHTREAIAKAVGMTWKDSPNHPATRRALKIGNGRSCMGVLMSLGLVVRLPGRPVRNGGQGHNLHLYAIAPHVRRQIPTGPQTQKRKVS